MTEPVLSDEDEATLKLLERLIEALTGKRFKFNQVPEHLKTGGRQAPRASFKLHVKRSREVHETETLDYRSKGQVVTEDGRTVDFELNLYNSRSYYEKSEISAEVSGTFHDPLVINLDGEGIDFGDKTLRIDLDLDGQVDAVKWLKNGSGFLALDKNANGTVDDGSELFGPESGNGFGELNAYDGDANGVIDENDAVFNRLKVWTLDAEGNATLIGLKEAGVGAIFLSYTQGQYHFKNDDDAYARIKATGTYLKETGQAMAIHEIDYKI